MSNSSHGRIIVVLSLTLLFVLASSIQGQQPDRNNHHITINTDLVVTWAHIFNKKDGSVVKGLDVDDLLLREDGDPQQIRLIKEAQPLSVVILVKGGYCGTWSQEWSFWRSQEALRQLGDDAEIALMGWEADVVLTQPLTKDHKVIVDQLKDRTYFLREIGRKRLQYTSDGNRHLPRPGEAVYQAAQYLERAASPGRRKIIIALTYPDWTDETHLHTASEVKELLEKTGITVYGVSQKGGGFTRSSSVRSKLSGQDKRRKDGGTIEEFAEHTGGSLFVGRPEEGDDMLIKIAGLISSSYTIGYYPSNSQFDGRFRHISLELSPRGKTKVSKVDIKTRDGYRAIRLSPQTASEIPQGASKK